MEEEKRSNGLSGSDGLGVECSGQYRQRINHMLSNQLSSLASQLASQPASQINIHADMCVTLRKYDDITDHIHRKDYAVKCSNIPNRHYDDNKGARLKALRRNPHNKCSQI